MGALGTTLAALRVTRYFGSFLLVLSDLFSPLIGIQRGGGRRAGRRFYCGEIFSRQHHGFAASLFAAAAVYPLMRKLIYRKDGSEEAEEKIGAVAALGPDRLTLAAERHTNWCSSKSSRARSISTFLLAASSVLTR